MILLDTDTCIGILRGYDIVLHKRKGCSEGIAVSFMTAAELYYGAERSRNPTKNHRLIEQFLMTVEILHPDRAVLQEFGRMKHALETQGIPLADADLFIAATCIKKCTKLITGNMKHYERIPGLKIENWLR